ncbi:hypothetical protein HELRODRAFT_174592 [Helobdella robusta]|uniref:Uncharacterized protein n=1 Tax=Helobdella robusta TaxID=6412 RepID=T1F8A3_HELRO|nr:hypothetical protein HELRODRAFT_174592 [Helobdella robusta]ESO01634.1 hypothetical protein HELRODRAFT_174592 [Helobdella robusta]
MNQVGIKFIPARNIHQHSRRQSKVQDSTRINKRNTFNRFSDKINVTESRYHTHDSCDLTGKRGYVLRITLKAVGLEFGPAKLFLLQDDRLVKVFWPTNTSDSDSLGYCIGFVEYFNYWQPVNYRFVWQVETEFFTENVTLSQNDNNENGLKLKTDKEEVLTNEKVTCIAENKKWDLKTAYVWHCIKDGDDNRDEENFVTRGSSIYFKTNGTYDCSCTGYSFYRNDNWRGTLTVHNRKTKKVELNCEKPPRHVKAAVHEGVNNKTTVSRNNM